MRSIFLVELVMQAWNSLRARETVALGRELLGGNGILADFLVAKVGHFTFKKSYWTTVQKLLVQLQCYHILRWKWVWTVWTSFQALCSVDPKSWSIFEMVFLQAFCDLEPIYTYEGTYEVNVLVTGREITGIPSIKPAAAGKVKGHLISQV